MSENIYKSDMSVDEKVVMAIVRIAERFKKESSALFKKWDLTFSQYNVLRVLDSSENGQNTMKNVNTIMLVSSANMTGIAKRLEKNGFILRTADSKDDRKKRLQITPKGRQVLKDISNHKEVTLQHYLDIYSGDQKNLLLEMLRNLLSYKK